MICDEAARIEDSLLASVSPALATTNGRLIALSTPFGKRGWFYKAWAFGGESWARYALRADQCPRISKEFLDEELRQHGEFLFGQEYRCEFLDPESAVFSSALIEAAFADESVRPLWE